MDLLARYYIGNSKPKLLHFVKVLADLAIKDEDDLEIIVRQRVKEKTDSQRNLWHKLLTEFGAALGYTAQESTTILKDAVKAELLGTREVTVGEHSHTVPLSSERQDRFNYSGLIEGTYRLAAQEGILLSDVTE